MQVNHLLTHAGSTYSIQTILAEAGPKHITLLYAFITYPVLADSTLTVAKISSISSPITCHL